MTEEKNQSGSAPSDSTSPEGATDKTGDKAGDKTGDDDTASADVVSLDAFRKKP